jgi:PPP family 3-phenylpropionic acid transporter
MDNTKVKFAVVQVCYWCAAASFASYMGAYMLSRGMSAALLGIMFAVNTLCAFCGQFFFGMLSDRLQTHKKILAVAILIAIALQFLLFFTYDFSLVICLFGLYGFILQPMNANIDTWILKTYSKTPQVYGPIRAVGSLSYAIFNCFYGGILARNGYGVMTLSATVFLLAGLATALSLPDVSGNGVKGKNTLSRGQLTALFRSRSYVSLLLLLFGTGIASGPLFQMLTVVMTYVGGSVEHLGYCMSISAIIQVPLMVFASRMHRISAKRRIAAAVSLYAVSLAVEAVSGSWQIVVLSSAVNGAGFGLYLPALREYIEESAPRGMSTTAQSAADAVSNSLGGMIGGVMSGALFGCMPVPNAIWICVGIQMFFICVFIFCAKIGGKKTDRCLPLGQ